MSALAISPTDRKAIERAHERRFGIGDLGTTLAFRGSDEKGSTWASTDIDCGSQIVVRIEADKRLKLVDTRASWWDDYVDGNDFAPDPLPADEPSIVLHDVAPTAGAGFAAKFLLAVAIAIFIGTCTLIYVDRARIMSAIAASEEVV